MTLQRLPEYVPPAPPTCLCGAWRAVVRVLVGDGCEDMCWLCAHMVTEHEVAPERTVLELARCKCKREDVYPPDEIRRRDESADRALRLARLACGRDPDDPSLPVGWRFRAGAGVDPGQPQAPEEVQPDTDGVRRVVRIRQ